MLYIKINNIKLKMATVKILSEPLIRFNQNLIVFSDPLGFH